jgi:hypothetical protein
MPRGLIPSAEPLSQLFPEKPLDMATVEIAIIMSNTRVVDRCLHGYGGKSNVRINKNDSIRMIGLLTKVPNDLRLPSGFVDSRGESN